MKWKSIVIFAALVGLLTMPVMAENIEIEQITENEAIFSSVSNEIEEETEKIIDYNATKLAAPDNLEWITSSAEYPAGTFLFSPVTNCEGSYNYVLTRDGIEVERGKLTGRYGSTKTSFSMVYAFSESGNYTISLKAIGDGINYNDSDWSTASFTYKRPSVSLGNAKKLQWNEKNPTTASFELPTNSAGWELELFRKSPGSDKFVSVGGTVNCSAAPLVDLVNTVDLSNIMEKPGTYKFRVRALSYDITQIANGEVSEWSKEINFTELLGTLNNELEENVNDINSGSITAKGARDNLANMDTNYLAAAIQASPDIYDKVEEIENAYNKEQGIRVDVKITDVSVKDVTVMGAGLNAKEGQSQVTLNVARPSEKTRELDARLRSVLEISMNLDGVTSTGKLDVPVCITMPQPANTFDLALRIFHYHADGTVETIWPEFITINGTPMIRFALTSFSDFVFAVENDTATVIKNGWYTENGQQVWYENGVKQGTTGRGKEIYDPDSDAWYWLDAPNGVKAVSKDVYQESLAGPWGDEVNADGERIGKWVRYDENGHMVKGWQSTAEGKYYFDLTYGTMAKGYATIDGKEYYFDPATGVLQYEIGTVPANGWKIIDGKAYWYENYVRQGYSVDSSYRGKEIYDPASDAWYWLDNIQGGAKAISKDVYQESEAGPWADRADGTGKWVRYDANGHMIKGWQTTAAGTYYFDLIYGTMAKGNATIEGKSYYFSPDTGILQ